MILSGYLYLCLYEVGFLLCCVEGIGGFRREVIIQIGSAWGISLRGDWVSLEEGLEISICMIWVVVRGFTLEELGRSRMEGEIMLLNWGFFSPWMTGCGGYCLRLGLQ